MNYYTVLFLVFLIRSVYSNPLYQEYQALGPVPKQCCQRKNNQNDILSQFMSQYFNNHLPKNSDPFFTETISHLLNGNQGNVEKVIEKMLLKEILGDKPGVSRNPCSCNCRTKPQPVCLKNNVMQYEKLLNPNEASNYCKKENVEKDTKDVNNNNITPNVVNNYYILSPEDADEEVINEFDMDLPSILNKQYKGRKSGQRKCKYVRNNRDCFCNQNFEDVIKPRLNFDSNKRGIFDCNSRPRKPSTDNYFDEDGLVEDKPRLSDEHDAVGRHRCRSDRPRPIVKNEWYYPIEESQKQKHNRQKYYMNKRRNEEFIDINNDNKITTEAPKKINNTEEKTTPVIKIKYIPRKPKNDVGNKINGIDIEKPKQIEVSKTDEKRIKNKENKDCRDLSPVYIPDEEVELEDTLILEDNSEYKYDNYFTKNNKLTPNFKINESDMIDLETVRKSTEIETHRAQSKVSYGVKDDEEIEEESTPCEKENITIVVATSVPDT